MQNTDGCRVLVAPYMQVVGTPCWREMLGIIAEAVNIARSDGVVQILQNISVYAEDEEKVLNEGEKHQLIVDAYRNLLDTFGDHGILKLKGVRSSDSIYVITIVPDSSEGVSC